MKKYAVIAREVRECGDEWVDLYETKEEALKRGRDDYLHLSDYDKKRQEVIVAEVDTIFEEVGGEQMDYGKGYYDIAIFNYDEFKKGNI